MRKLLLTLLLLFGSASPAFAQTASTSASPNPELQTWQATYTQNLSTYRNDERLYTIALGQYKQLQTLASLEAAVQATRQVMLSRVSVLQAYLKILEANVQMTPGIDPSLKSLQVQKIEAMITSLQTHANHVQLASDRIAIASMVAEFAQLQPQTSQVARGTVALIRYGNIQQVFNNTITARNDIGNAINADEKDVLVLAEKKRGLDEIDRQLKVIVDQMTHAQDEIHKGLSSPQYSLDDGGFAGELETIYGGLSRILSLLGESISTNE